MFVWKLYLFFFIICDHLPWQIPPAEGIEHVEEGDEDIDEDDQGEQGVWTKKSIILVNQQQIKSMVTFSTGNCCVLAKVWMLSWTQTGKQNLIYDIDGFQNKKTSNV